MTLPTVIPGAFPLVGLGLVATAILNSWQVILVSDARKKSGVLLPNLYASDAEAKADKKKMIFNCTQRAHANTLENVWMIVMLTAFLGLYHPKVASSLNLIWVIARVFYTIGYCTGDPQKRYYGLSMSQYIGTFGLLGGSAWVAGTESYKLLA